MRRNAAEQVFIDVLSEVPSIRRNGVTHSDEYYEAMLDDANLSNEERAEVLTTIRHAIKPKIEELDEEHCKIAYRVAAFDDDPTLIGKSISEQQRADFDRQIFLLSTSIFVAILIILLTLLAFESISMIGLIIAIIPAYIVAFALARVMSDKTVINVQVEREFLEELDEERQKLVEIRADILSLERLRTFAKEASGNNLEDAMDDLDDLK